MLPRPSRWTDGKLSESYRPVRIRLPVAVPSRAPFLFPRVRAPLQATPTSACAAPVLRPRLRTPMSPYLRPSWTTPTSGPLHTPSPCFPPAPPFANLGIRSVSTMQEAFRNARNSQLDRWLGIACSARKDSDVISDLLRQPGGETHMVRLVVSYAPATLSAYFNCWDQWVSFCAVLSESQFSPSLRVLLDFLQVHARGTSQSAVGWIKGLRFVARRLEIPSLISALATSAVSSYARAAVATQRLETAPLPLSFVIWLEVQILDVTLSPARRLQCGAFLTCILASLRWSDALWSSPAKVHAVESAVLGCAMRTKTTSRSMPWAALASGFTSRPVGGPGWGQVFVQLLQEAVHTTTSLHPNFEPDFLLAELGDDPWRPQLLGPLSRHRGILLLRSLLRDCYSSTPAEKRPDLDLIGVHSLKVTLLSVAKQLLLDDNLRRQQGHHRSVSGAMPELYGRDDIAGPLELQQQVVRAVASGFRPLRPSARGSRPPLPDVPFTVPALAPAEPSGEIPALSARPPAELDVDSSSDSEDDDPGAGLVRAAASSSTSGTFDLVSFAPDGAPASTCVPLPAVPSDEVTSSSSPDSALSAAWQAAEDAEEFEFLFNPVRHVLHLAKTL
ncbi:unnamed protein product [Symbiodinium natans]|uniref:Uncharacterized protein n=1 Tax=Symbiodinium natans TaxID=878477 RepID=A0A812T925_9DINO|nr:unnamed protein product [Symbiodinium natans]